MNLTIAINLNNEDVQWNVYCFPQTSLFYKTFVKMLFKPATSSVRDQSIPIARHTKEGCLNLPQFMLVIYQIGRIG